MLAFGHRSVHAAACDGPSECCAGQIVHGAPMRSVALGVAILGLSNINERAGTWDADYYLMEEWSAAPGFTPQTEIVNELSRLGTQYDTTLLVDGHCSRSRRIRSTLRATYNLRRFPFDHQELAIEISDDEFPASELRYLDTPSALGFEDAARETLSSWKIECDPVLTHVVQAFRWERGTPEYDNASVTFGVRRHVTFHLFKYFLPLFVIVALAFSVFWIDPDELGAPATIGITCLLAAIAFQFAEASTLPEVSYLTLADRVYVVCYVAIGAALFETITANALARRGERERALRIDGWCRCLFPVGTLIALAASIVRAFTQ
ncbi:MAG TPA: hypothetical protein VGM88_04590 [Kofleriaceae bacterium]